MTQHTEARRRLSGATGAAEPIFMSPQEAAVYAGCSVDTIRRRIADGSLPASRLGKRLIRLDKNDLDNLFRPIEVER